MPKFLIATTTMQKVDWDQVKKKIESYGAPIFPYEECEIDSNSIGQGAAMIVYKGTCRIKNQVRHAAFKEHRSFVGRRLPPNNVDQILDQFRHEIKLMAKLRDHPNIIQILGVTFKANRPLLIVELADQTLENYLLERESPLSWCDKTKLCLDILSGVRGLCEKEIIHGDLKSLNVLILIDEAGSPKAKISDFGFSLPMSSIQSRVGGGTLRFSAPESTSQYLELLPWRKRIEQNIYGLGMVIFQIVTNGTETPYIEYDGAEYMFVVKDDPTVLLAQLPQDTPEVYSEIIKETTKFMPSDRASLDTVEKLLKDALENFAWEVNVGEKRIAAEELLATYINSDGIKYIDAGDNIDFEKVLFLAVELNHKDVIKLLLKYHIAGASIKDNIQGLNLLHYAAKLGHAEIVKMLINEFGMDINSKDNFGRTAMHYAAKNDDIDVITILVNEFGMDINSKDNFGRTSVHYASKNGNVDVIKFLASVSNADLTVINNDGWTSLHYASRYRYIDVIKALTNKIRAVVNNKDVSGQTAMYLAASQGDGNIIRELAALGADVNIVRSDGWAPLHIASFHGKLEAVRVLIELGAVKNSKVLSGDREGYTPLDMAKVHKNADVIRVIKGAGGSKGVPKWLRLFKP